MQPRVLVLRAPGTNCDGETAYAFERAGAQADAVHVNRVLEDPSLLARSQILCLPGGFSYGDDIAAGRILGTQLRRLAGVLQDFRAAGKLVLGVCNGFQVMIKSGLFLDIDGPRGPAATLTWNASGKFEDRWVHLQASGDKCVFLQGIDRLYLPIAHAEGRFVARDQESLVRLETAGQLPLRYASHPSVPLALAPAGVPLAMPVPAPASVPDILPHPLNPNGSVANVAGLCDTTGRVLGLMPHPERHIDRTQHPRWTRGEGQPDGDGLRIFQNAVEYFR